MHVPGIPISYYWKSFLLETDDDPFETAKILNRDLAKIYSWSVNWKVTFNPIKSKDITLSRNILSDSPPIFINNTVVSRSYVKLTHIFGVLYFFA